MRQLTRCRDSLRNILPWTRCADPPLTPGGNPTRLQHVIIAAQWWLCSGMSHAPSFQVAETAAVAGVYLMRMARVNITVPDDVLSRARAAGLNVSRVASAALAEELDRLAKIAALDAYLSELDTELAPISEQERASARDWADQALFAGERHFRSSRDTSPA